MPRFGFTEHAIDRFIMRHAPHLSRAEARCYLEEAVLKAVRLKEKTFNGETQWQIEDGTVLVTKIDNRENVCVTNLPGPRHYGPSDDELEMMREYASRPTPSPEPGEAALREISLGSARSFVEMALSDKQLKRLLHLGHLEASKTRQQEKTRRHETVQSAEAAKLRSILRVAVRGLRTIKDGEGILQEMRTVEKDFLTNLTLKKAS